MQGTVVLFPAEDVKRDRVVVALGWHTEGRGDRDKDCAGEVSIIRGPLTAHTSVTRDFGLRLPAQPWSYEAVRREALLDQPYGISLDCAFDDLPSIVEQWVERVLQDFSMSFWCWAAK